ncbi:copper oxidase (laccase) domain-containing protein [Acidovorax delafieldii]|uniref:polyphenol oxidase family protein n=1 Tax=Acidovorax delafieldii TaxID=47920 RepID=UPI0028571F6D|nr:polyphenol oxidase family protein [Acidovorax delafieldii]MDR6153320.1 copper oxidase (laccase) domain-containing protein [Acidovorax delafieldii]
MTPVSSSVPSRHADWLAPDWPAPPGVHALCTTRTGGASRAPYDQFNLGAHVGDDPLAVAANRQTLQSALQSTTPDARAVFLNQVHGDGVVLLDASTPDGTEADACVASAPGAVCTIMVADCLPVLLAHRSGLVVAAAHAGWRGLAGHAGQGVLESVFKHFCHEALVRNASVAIKNGASAPASLVTSELAAHTLAWLGPCIGPTAFEVGAEVRAAFCDAPGALGTAAAPCFVARPDAPGKYLCDLAGLARLRLRAMGITHIYGNDSTPPWCTVTQASRFFSHRRDSAALGGSGRFAACIWRG